MKLNNMNVVDSIFNALDIFANKDAVVDCNLKLTYGQLKDHADVVANDLKDRGLKAFDKVAFLCDDSAEYIVVVLAILSLKAVVVPISPSLSFDELDSVVEKLKVQYFIADNAVLRKKESVCLQVIRKKILFEAKFVNDISSAEFKALDPAFIRFSSGTTGASKGVLLSHKAIIERTDAANEALQINAEDNVIWLLSMSFHFVVTILLFLRKAATIILAGNDFPKGLWNALEHNKATFVYASPFHYNIMCSSANCRPEFLSTVRMAVSTAVALPERIESNFADKFKFNLSQAYGIIEVGLPFVNNNRCKHGSVGKLLSSYCLKINKPDEEGCGEILLKGRGMYDAYLDPWALSADWFNTGDIGRLDDDGYLYIVGRSKNVINFSGMKIFPYEVEDVLNSHNAIKESLVYGQAHDEYGQLPVAKVILADDYDKFPRSEIRRYCQSKLSAYKIPKSFELVDELAKTASGKLKRN